MALDWKDILKAAKDQGWREEPIKKGIRLVPPDTSKPAVVIHRTPSDNRAIRNTVSQMRRSGLNWPPGEKR